MQKTKKQNKKRVLSLFSGCGGMDLGFEGGFEVFADSVNETLHPTWIKKQKGKKVLLSETDFEIVFSNDILKSAEIAWTNYFHKKNNTSNTFHNESVVDLVKFAKRGEFEFPSGIDIVLGGFPCQDFSLSGKRNGFKSHKNHKNEITNSKVATEENRGLLYTWMREVIALTKPKIFIAENVKGLVSLGDVKQVIEDDFRSIDKGYFVLPARVLNAKDYGVPQNRERVIFIGISKRYIRKNPLNQLLVNPDAENLNPYPIQTHGKSVGKLFGEKNNLINYVSLKTILDDLKEPELEPNDLSQQSYSKAKYYGKMQGNVEIKPNGVAPTIRAEHHGNIEFRRLSKENGGIIENELNKGLPERRLTVRECARIQTFPDDYEFVIKKERKNSLSASAGYKVIGNAVPPLLAYNLAKRIEFIWNDLFGEN